MNSVQIKVFELFKCFVELCDELKLRWYLINGSALGAVKYHGFIPWDDDLDVGMPREDYEVFVREAQRLLPENVFLQNYKTDKNFPQIYSKLRDSCTAFIEKSVRHIKMNHGIFIDVFPLDGYVNDDAKSLGLFEKLLTWRIVCAFNDRTSVKIRVRNAFFRAMGCHKRTASYISKTDKANAREWKECSYVCNYGDRQTSKRVIPIEYYGEGSVTVFEGLTVRVPQMFEEYLTYKYGAWREELPEDEKVSHHITWICDTEKSYVKYIDF